MRDVLNNIITAQPPAPSVILSQRESREVARRIKRGGLNNKLVNPALDAIVLKALTKRRDDRYQSAGDLAQDIESYLAGRPLQASGVPIKATSRTMLAIVAVALVIGVGWIVLAMMRTNNQPAAPQSIAVTSNASSNAVDPLREVKTNQLPSMVAASPLRQEYQDMELIMNRFMPIITYIRANAPARFAVWRDAAERGDAVGQMLMGRCYEYGEGTKRNDDAGARYMQLAADQKLPMALCLIGLKYRASLPPIRDYEQAIHWYTLAAEAGNARAMIDLGIMHSQGQGTPVDSQAAKKWFQKAADLGAPAAYAFLGDIYRTPGNGITDLPRAVSMYKRAVDVGAPIGYLSLGQMYVNGSGVPQDFAEAMRLLLRADAEEVFGAAERIGDLYYGGRGVTQDFEQAARWYQKAVNTNAVPAMRKLAALYEQGNGLPKDQQKAIALYNRAASAGDEAAKKWVNENPSTLPADEK
jgi:TPR repeat protein